MISCLFRFVLLSYSDLEGGIWFLIVSFPDHYLSFYLSKIGKIDVVLVLSVLYGFPCLSYSYPVSLYFSDFVCLLSKIIIIFCCCCCLSCSFRLLAMTWVGLLCDHGLSWLSALIGLLSWFLVGVLCSFPFLGIFFLSL